MHVHNKGIRNLEENEHRSKRISLRGKSEDKKKCEDGQCIVLTANVTLFLMSVPYILKRNYPQSLLLFKILGL